MTLRTGLQTGLMLLGGVFVSLLTIPLMLVLIWFAVLSAPLLFFFVLPAGLVLFWLVHTWIESNLSRSLAKKRILVVDDEEAAIAPLLGLLTHFKAEVVYVTTGAAMIEQIQNADWDLIVLDSVMHPLSGEAALLESDRYHWRFHNSFEDRSSKTPVIFFTARTRWIPPTALTHFYILDTWSKLHLSTLPTRVSNTLGALGASSRTKAA